MSDTPIEYPSLGRRMFSELIDGLAIFVIFVSISKIIYSKNHQGHNPQEIYLLYFVIVFVYYPVLNTFLCTAGQWMTHTRVKQRSKCGLSFVQAANRFIGKAFLGWTSIIVIFFTKEGRLVHDLMGQSIVLDTEQLESSLMLNEESLEKSKWIILFQIFKYALFLLYCGLLIWFIWQVLSNRIN